MHSIGNHFNPILLIMIPLLAIAMAMPDKRNPTQFRPPNPLGDVRRTTAIPNNIAARPLARTAELNPDSSRPDSSHPDSTHPDSPRPGPLGTESIYQDSIYQDSSLDPTYDRSDPALDFNSRIADFVKAAYNDLGDNKGDAAQTIANNQGDFNTLNALMNGDLGEVLNAVLEIRLRELELSIRHTHTMQEVIGGLMADPAARRGLP